MPNYGAFGAAAQGLGEGLGGVVNAYQAAYQGEKQRRAAQAQQELKNKLEQDKYDLDKMRTLADIKKMEADARIKANPTVVPKPIDFNAEQNKNVAAVSEAAQSLKELADIHEQTGMSKLTPTMGGVSSGLSKVPVFGSVLSPQTKQYNDKARITAETWLRAATGAAAPETEVRTYVGFLPQPGDPPNVAANKMRNFMDKVAAKGLSVADTFEVEGKSDQAAQIRERLKAVRERSGIDERISKMGGGQSNAKADRARQALNDPEATPEEKAQAQKILSQLGGQ